MVKVEYKELWFWRTLRRIPAARISFSEGHYLAVHEVKPLFGWTDDDVISETKCDRVIFTHYLAAAAIYQDESPLRWVTSDNKRASLTLVPLQAFVPVDSWMGKVAKYVTARHPRLPITAEEIQGAEKLKEQVHRLYPNRK